jgi:hypothetical protein
VAERNAEYRFKRVRVDGPLEMPGGGSIYPFSAGDYQVFSTLDGRFIGRVTDAFCREWIAQRPAGPGTRTCSTRRAAAEWLLSEHKALLRERERRGT